MVVPKWLEQPMATLRGAHAAGRLPHALLIHDAGDAGGDWLAQWAAKLALCTGSPPAPCGACVSCRRVKSAQHPDLIDIHPVDDSKQIRIEQVRDLAAELALTAHQGGYKVGILSPADVLNRFAANALLKTLEEPPPRTLLILVARQPSRLPATILSRCQRLTVRTPGRAEAVEWLTSERGPADWNAILDTLGNAPFAAAAADTKAVPALGAETRRRLEELGRGAADPAATAEQWSRSDLPLRLTCFENWLTERIRAHFASGGLSVEKPGTAHLSRREGPANIRRLFELADGVRELKMLLEAPINRSIALENLLRRLPPG